MKKLLSFYLKIFSFLEVKFSLYLNRRVFVMLLTQTRTLLALLFTKVGQVASNMVT